MCVSRPCFLYLLHQRWDFNQLTVHTVLHKNICDPVSFEVTSISSELLMCLGFRLQEIWSKDIINLIGFIGNLLIHCNQWIEILKLFLSDFCTLNGIAEVMAKKIVFIFKLADAFIQSVWNCIQYVHFISYCISGESNTWTWHSYYSYKFSVWLSKQGLLS